MESSSASNISALVRKRAVYKRKITLSINNAASDSSPDNLVACKKVISSNLEQVILLDDAINTAYLEIEQDEEFSEAYSAELDQQTDYILYYAY